MKKRLAPASRSQGTADRPAAHFVRLTEEQNERLHEAVRRDGRGSIQAFIHGATMAAVAASERERREVAQTRTEASHNTAAPTAPRGYGLRRHFEAEPAPYDEAPPPEPAPAAPAPPQIVIAQAATVPATSEIDRLAAFVAHGGPPHERDRRLETAAQILSVSAKDEAEKPVLAKTLDERLSVMEGRPRPAAPVSPLSFITDFFK